MKKKIRFSDTPFGFEWGAADFSRCIHDSAKGWVIVLLKTPRHKEGIQLYITKTGKVRVFGSDGKEWLPKK